MKKENLIIPVLENPSDIISAIDPNLKPLKIREIICSEPINYLIDSPTKSKDIVTMSYNRYEELITLFGENVRLSTHLKEFKNSIFYKMWKFFNT